MSSSRARPQGLGPTGPESDRLPIGIPPAEPPRKRRRGGKTYFGCGTCRTRKIKCDERRPRCYNCERSRLYLCDGYEELGGAGMVFPSAEDGFDWTQTLSFSDVSLSGLPQDGSSGQTIDGDATEWDALGDFMRDFSESPPQDPGSHSPQQPEVRTGQRVGHDVSTSQSQTIVAAGSDEVPRRTLPLLDPVLAPDVTRRLLHHYRTHVCELMMPTSAPSNNPWLQVYLPLALNEASSVPQQVLLHAILAVAAFNRSYLASADKAADVKQGSGYYQHAVTRLRTFLSSGDLPSELGENTSARLALMAAALTLTTVEVFSGASGGDGYDHLQLCRRVIQLTGGFKWWLSDPTCRTLLQIFRCLQIVALTSGRLEPPESQPEESSLQDCIHVEAPAQPPVSSTSDRGDLVAAPVPPGYTLDVTFGISMKTLLCLDQIAEFARVKAAILPGESWPADRIPGLLRLEAELFDRLEDVEASADHETPAPHPQGNTFNYIGEVIKENHMLAFQYSAAIYFRRALCDGSAQITPAVSHTKDAKPRPTGQFLVSKALDYLENIDALSRNIAVANTLWPGFIAAIEAVDTDLRHRALIWLARARRHGIGNVSRATALLMEVWRRVDRQFVARVDQDGLLFELGCVDWREVMREKQIYIMLT